MLAQLSIAIVLTGAGMLALPQPASAITCPDGSYRPDAEAHLCPEADDSRAPAAVKSDCQGDNIQAGAPEGSEEHCGILDYLVLFINVLSGLVGVVVLGSIIYGGIQYSSAGSDPQKVQAAKNRIRNALIALFFFIFMYGFLNYLVPGGIL